MCGFWKTLLNGVETRDSENLLRVLFGVDLDVLVGLTVPYE
jgi:hypothetical protein